MKIYKYQIPLVFFIVFIFSCKKESETPYTMDLSNTIWSDSANINTVPYKPFTVTFHNDGTAEIQFLTFTPYEGTWNKPLYNDTVYFFFDESSNVKWIATGVLSDNNKVITGTLTTPSSSSLTGTFIIRKQ